MIMNQRYLDLVTGPASEPVTIASLQANEYLKGVDLTDTETAALFTTDIIPSARTAVEEYMNRKLFTQTWNLTLDAPEGHVYFPFGQLQSVSSVKIYNSSNVAVTESSSRYTIKTGDNGQLWVNSGSSWATTPRAYNAFVIQFVCGWASAASIPKDITTAIMTLCAYLYYNREDHSLYENACTLLQKHWTISPGV